MKESRKFYYIDKDGNKKKYVGKIISDNDSYNGILTKTEKIDVKVNLKYYPEVEEVIGHKEYFSYVDKNNEEVVYLDVVKRDNEGNYYFIQNEKNMYKLNYHPQIDAQEEYYTYLDSNGNECKYSGKIFYDKDKNSYTGFIDK